MQQKPGTDGSVHKGKNRGQTDLSTRVGGKVLVDVHCWGQIRLSPVFAFPRFLFLVVFALASLAWGADTRPKVRAITAFINIDPKTYSTEIENTVQFLNSVREAYRGAGFEVEGIRIATQPFTRYIGGMKREEALAFFHKLDELSTKLKYAPNIGAAMVEDGDDASLLDLLATVLATSRLNASLIVAGEDGVHWRAIREAARLIKNTAERSPHGGGNFNFAVTAMVKPYGPFYPGAYHLGTGPWTANSQSAIRGLSFSSLPTRLHCE